MGQVVSLIPWDVPTLLEVCSSVCQIPLGQMVEDPNPSQADIRFTQ